MSDTIQRFHAIVHGRVQGVSFRYYATVKANELDVVGWVRNCSDGTVEVLAEGAEDALEQFEAWLHEGSPHARVEEIYVTREDATGEFSEFRTMYFRDTDY